MIVAYGGEWRSGCWVLERGDEIGGGFDGGIGGGWRRHGAGGWEKFDGVRNSRGSSAGDVYFVAPIVVRGVADIPAVNTMRCPRASDAGLFVDDYFCSEWGQGCSIKVEGAIEEGLGR